MHSLSEAVQEDVLRVIFENMCTRLYVFDAADMAPFLFQGILHLIGSVCAACIPIAWENNAPLILQEVLLESGDAMCDCVPLDEARFWAFFKNHAPHPAQHCYAITIFYGDEGRFPLFMTSSRQAVIGQLDSSLVWRTWRSIYLSVLVNLFPSTNFRTPGSLSSYAARSIINAYDRLFLSVPSSILVHVLNQGIFSPVSEVTSLRLYCSNLRHNESILNAASSRMVLVRVFLESVQAFLDTPEINRNSSEEELDQCSRSLALMMRSIPFCGYSFYQSACLLYMVEYLIDHLFGVASCLSENRRRVASLGPRRMANCFWNLVVYALVDLEQAPLLSNTNRIRFLRQCFVLYDRYFVRRRPFSQEASNADN